MIIIDKQKSKAHHFSKPWIHFYQANILLLTKETNYNKLLYLRITELYKKRNGSKVENWARVRKQLTPNGTIKARIEKYEHLI